MNPLNYLLLTFLLMSCGDSIRHLDTRNYDGATISFGSGGGITGERTEYLLLDDGRMFLSSEPFTQDSLAYMRKISRNKVQKLFDHYEQIKHTKCNAPGNIYYFVNYSDQNEQNQLTWGDPNTSVDTNLVYLWEQLNSLVK